MQSAVTILAIGSLIASIVCVATDKVPVKAVTLLLAVTVTLMALR